MTAPAASRPPCWGCGRRIARLTPRHGKRRARHLCPHGVPCIAGTWRGGQGHNGPPPAGPNHCPACWEAWQRGELHDGA